MFDQTELHYMQANRSNFCSMMASTACLEARVISLFSLCSTWNCGFSARGFCLSLVHKNASVHEFTQLFCTSNLFRRTFCILTPISTDKNSRISKHFISFARTSQTGELLTYSGYIEWWAFSIVLHPEAWKMFYKRMIDLTFADRTAEQPPEHEMPSTIFICAKTISQNNPTENNFFQKSCNQIVKEQNWSEQIFCCVQTHWLQC